MKCCTTITTKISQFVCFLVRTLQPLTFTLVTTISSQDQGCYFFGFYQVSFSLRIQQRLNVLLNKLVRSDWTYYHLYLFKIFKSCCYTVYKLLFNLAQSWKGIDKIIGVDEIFNQVYLLFILCRNPNMLSSCKISCNLVQYQLNLSNWSFISQYFFLLLICFILCAESRQVKMTVQRGWKYLKSNKNALF